MSKVLPLNMKKGTIIAIVSTVLIELIWQSYKRCWASAIFGTCAKGKNIKDKEKIVEAMFFSNECLNCRDHAHLESPCVKSDCAVKHMRKMISYISSATRTIDVCMFFFTCHYLAKAIGEAKSRGVVVRLVLDETMTCNEDSQNMYFYKIGAKVRINKQNPLMHHKFVIIDNEILMTGSVNWTMSGLFGNFDNLLITNESTLVESFSKEFEKIWIKMDTKKVDVPKSISPKTRNTQKTHA